MSEKPESNYVVFKHDVETKVANAVRMAEIEHKWGHKGSYYVQAYLIEDEKNVQMLKKIQDMGHEISYHYDVMDSNRGDISLAIVDFEEKRKSFEGKGFQIITVCQHGNPIIERVGYNSNRDFFRNEKVKEKFPHISDIMVDFKDKAFGGTDYLYFSDAGRKFKLIYDPINNDIIPSEDKNIPFKKLELLWSCVEEKSANAIISTHPHRWMRSKMGYILRTAIFKVVKAIAKVLIKIPVFKKFMSKYYYLAKKI